MNAEKMKKSNTFLLVYGSETGQAKAIAEQIAEKAPDFGVHANLHCLDKLSKGFNIEEETCMVMVTSTTGDGDAPENASKFLRKIKKRTLASDYLSHLHYTILGLGDTNYNNFCKCGRDMDSRLEQLGAKRFYPTGLADDGVGIEIVVDPWLEGLYPALKAFLNQENIVSDEVSLSERISAFKVTADDDNEANHRLQQQNGSETISEECSPLHIKSNNSKFLAEDCDSVDSTVTAGSSHNGLINSDLESTNVVDNDNVILLNVNSNSSDSNVDIISVRSEKLNNSEDASGHENENMKDKLPEPETRCEKLYLAGTTDSNILTSCSPSLKDKDLIIPVLGPEFLHTLYTDEKPEMVKLPFQNGCKLPSAASDIIHVCVSDARVLTQPDSVKKSICLRLSIKKSQDQEIHYSPGDSLSVICANNKSEVQLLLERLGGTHLADKQLSLSLIPNTKKRRAAIPPHIHPVTTLRHLLETCVNIRDPPSKALLRALIEYTTSDKEVRRLQELCSKEGTEEYTKCIREKNVSLLDLLYAFVSCQPPLERVLEFLPRLLPRPYSICSSPETQPESLDIVFNVVEIPGSISDGHYYHRRGVCTGWLDDITACIQTCDRSSDAMVGKGDIEIPLFFRTNQHFRPPSDLTRPLILIGPGTGVAPFIGFLQQRALLKSKAEGGQCGETWLFTGCRNREKDFIFGDELQALSDSGTISKLCTSFSRDLGSTHRYVQDYMKSESSNLARLIVEEEALVYVCGDAKHMAKDVTATFQEILVSEKGFSTDEASAFIMKKRLHKSYLEDVWV